MQETLAFRCRGSNLQDYEYLSYSAYEGGSPEHFRVHSVLIQLNCDIRVSVKKSNTSKGPRKALSVDIVAVNGFFLLFYRKYRFNCTSCIFQNVCYVVLKPFA